MALELHNASQVVGKTVGNGVYPRIPLRSIQATHFVLSSGDGRVLFPQGILNTYGYMYSNIYYFIE